MRIIGYKKRKSRRVEEINKKRLGRPYFYSE